MKADLSGNMWLVAPESVTVKQRPGVGRMEAANIRLIMEERCLDSTISVEEEATGRVEGKGRGASGGGKALTTT